MDSSIKWLLLGVGAYLVYENYIAAPATAATAAGGATSTTGNAAGAAGAAPATPASLTPAQQQAQQQLQLLTAVGSQPLLAAAQQHGLPANGQMTASQWNWYLAQITGVNVVSADDGAEFATLLPPPANVDGNAAVTLPVFWGAVMNWAQLQLQHANSAASTATSTAGASGTGVSGLGDLGYRDAGGSFAQPPAPHHGRFDMTETGW